MPAAGVRDLARDELEPAALALVVEEDPGGGEEVVALAVVHGDEVAVALGDPVGRARVERRGLALRHLEHLPEHLGGGRLVEARLRRDLAHGLEHARDAGGGELRREHRLRPGGRHERHGGEVVDLVGLALAEHVDERALVEEVAGVEHEVVAEPLEPLEGLGRGAPDHAVHLVALLEQELREVGAVLPRDAGDERALRSHQPADPFLVPKPADRVGDPLAQADARLPAEQPPRLLDRRPAALHVDLEGRQVLELELRRILARTPPR